MSITTTTNAKIQLSLEGVQQVESGLARVQGVAGSAAKALAGIAGGVFSAVAFKDWIQGAIDAADETNKLTQKTGLLAEQVAGLKLAFEQGGAGDAFASSLSRLAKEAVSGNKAFATMGISVTDAGGKMKSTRDLFAEVADKFAGYGASLEKNALAVQLFGRAGADLIPVLNGGSASIDEMDAKAKALGLTMGGEMVKAAEQFNDQMDLVKGGLQGTAIQIASALLPALVQLSDGLANSAEQGGAVAQVGNGLATVFETVAVLGSNVGYVLKQVGNELGGLAAQAVQVAQLDFAAAGEIGRMMRADAAQARKEIDELSDRLINARRRSTIGVASADDQSSAEARRLGLRTTLRTAPIVPDASSRGFKGGGSADREAAAALRELTEARKRDFEVVKLRNQTVQEAWELEQKQAQAAIDAVAELIEGRRSAAASTMEAVEAQRQANAEYGLEGVALVELQNARLLDAAAALDRRAALAQDIDFSGAMSEAYAQEAKALRELAGARLSGAVSQQQARELDKQAKAYEQMWQGVEGFAENAFMDIALNGEDAFKRIGESIKREVIQLLYEMTIKKWIFQIAGVSGGGGGGVDWVSLAQSAYSNYTGGGGAGGLGSLFGGGGAAAAGTSAYGSSYAAGSVSSSAMVSTGSSAAASGSASTSIMGYFGYAALIAAAVMVASNLYEKGYTRMALGYGGSETAKFGQYSSYNTDPNTQRAGAMQNSPAMLMTNDMRKFNEALGMSSKWADILSGTTRMATLVGRKLSAYGYEANIAGGDADVSGFARYKGGVFRSNKTVAAEVDPRDAANFDAIVESTIEGARGMARAMGYSGEAIDGFTGKIRVNFKNAKTAEEQAQRMAEAMDNLQFELLKTAAGGKLARDEFKALMEGIQKDIEAAGISTQGMTDILANGIVNGLSGEEIGSQLSQMILGGVYTSLAQNAFAPVAASITAQLITPLFTAMAAGVPIANVISKQAIASVVAQAQAASAALNQVFANAEFQAAMAGISSAISGVSGAAASVHVPRISAPKPINTTAADTAREKEQLERELLRLQGNTNELRRRELLDLKPGNRALQERIWALEDEQEALEKVTQLQDAWTDLTGSIEDEIKRLRGIVSGEGSANLAYLQAQFAIVTGQARAMDQDAAGRLPDLSSQLADLYMESSTSLNEYQRRVNSLAASLEETNRITRATAGIGADNAQKVEDKALAQKIELLQKSVDVLQATMAANTKASETTSKVLNGSFNGSGLRTQAVA